jgi:hypothetical protein
VSPDDLRGRTLVITPELSISALGPFTRTPEYVLRGVPELLDWAIRSAPGITLGDELTVITTRGVAHAWGWVMAPSGGLIVRDATVESLARSGWRHASLAPWTTFRRRGMPTVHLAVHEWLPADRWPLRADAAGDDLPPAALCAIHDLWQSLTGSAYRGTPGVAGGAILRRLWQHQAGEPRWRPNHPAPERVTTRSVERDLIWRDEVTPRPAGGLHTHTYDVNRQYLAAAGIVALARDELAGAPTAVDAVRRWSDFKQPGYYLINAAPWQGHPPAIPPPLAGSGVTDMGHTEGGGAWVTHPTLELLDQLTDRGLYGGYSIIDAYTAPGARLLRRWAEILRDVTDPTAHYNPIPILTAGKAAYRETIGLFGRPGGAIERPDWRHAVIAQARCNLWRRLYLGALTSDPGTRLPVEVHIDAATYPCDGTQCDQHPVPVGVGLGKFKLVEVPADTTKV